MEYFAKSDKGKIREVNEDYYNIIINYHNIPPTFIIADGMGGHNYGEIASKLAVDCASSNILQINDYLQKGFDIPNFIKTIFRLSNNLVTHEANSTLELNGMGTTMIISLIYEGKLFIGHVGDSRVYLIREGKILRLTTDHSYIEELIKTGSLTREEAESHPKKNLITRALGCFENLEVDIYTYNIKKNDYILLCTDGLTNELIEDEILDCFNNSTDPKKLCEELIIKANKRGGEDNITVIIFESDGEH